MSEEKMFGAEFGLTNQFGALVLDEPLSAMNQNSKKRNKKSQRKRNKAKKNNDKEKSPDDLEGLMQDTFNEPSQMVEKAPETKPNQKKTKAQIPVKRQLTLDEYWQEQASAANRRRYIAPIYNLRQPGEGEDLSQWQNLVPLVKEKEKFEEKAAVVEYFSALELPQRTERLHSLPLDVKFNDDKGKRWKRARAERDEAAASPERPKIQRPPRVQNEKEFPYLDKTIKALR